MVEQISPKERQIFQDIAETGILQSLKALAKLSGKNWSAFPKQMAFCSYEEGMKFFPAKEASRFAGVLNLGGNMPISFIGIYPQESAINLTHFLTLNTQPESAAMPVMQNMAIAEISNILITKFLNVIANTLSVSLLPTPPQVFIGPRKALIESAVSSAKLSPEYMLTTELRLESENLAMTTMLCIVLDIKSFKNLVARIHQSPAWVTQRWRMI